jgi:peptidoglycan/xylan/chitin deacetylase (PgdA/CDA1 family)
MTKAISLKRLGREMLSIASFYSGYCALSEYLKLNYGARILCFHGISDNPVSQYAVSTSDFSKQMYLLSGNYKIFSIDQLVTYIRERKLLSPTMIAISFDDGYQDFYTHAFPILQQYSIPATVFLPTSFIDKISKYEQVLPQSEFLLWDQIREMQQNGISFGSHTVSHTSLTRLTQQQIQNELEYSKARIESETNVSIKGFAYPYGTFRDTDSKIGNLIANSGYSWAVTSISGINNTKSDLFALRRTVIMRNDGLLGFKRALKGALDGWIVMQKGGYYLDKVIP